jgi:DNA repair photolyase
MKIREILARTVLSKTGIGSFDYCVNPYVGCGHGCRYCYASFMKRFTGHLEPWGDFVDIKLNAPELLKKRLKKANRGIVALSTVTDPYQPVEKKYQLTRKCLEALLERQFPVSILTRSPLCLRDMDLFRRFDSIRVGFSITTDDEEIKDIFEPHSPSIQSRAEALKALHREGIPTYAFVGPMLPLDPARLAALVEGSIEEVLVDRLNYVNKVKTLYRNTHMEKFLDDAYFHLYGVELRKQFEDRGVRVSMLF